jgi:hypothetical protein
MACIETVALDETLREAERHRGVVSPLPCFESMVTAGTQVHNGFERSRAFELDGRTEGISDREPEQSSIIALVHFHYS